jgi:selenide,water dikinase
MAERSQGAFRIESSLLPLYPGAREIAARGVRTGGDARNRTAVGSHVRLADGVDPAFDTIAFDPQTSGGLLAAVAPESVDALRGVFTVIGEVVDGERGLHIV